MESGEMYKSMVDETLGLINDIVDKETKRPYCFENAKDGIVIIAIHSF